MPTVSVIMAVHNGLPYLEEAVGSILGQRLADFEFIVVEDGSTDGSAAWLATQQDSRLRLVSNPQQMGLTRSLNKALENAECKYVARMDADDISHPKRLEAQVAYLQQHPKVDVLGTWARTLGKRPEQTWRYPQADAEIRCELLFHSVLVHSSVMWRRETFERHKLAYGAQITRAQDYELWARAADRVRFANLGQVLVRYRVHPDQVGRVQGEEQQAVAASVRLRQLRALGLQPSREEIELHNEISQWRFPVDEHGLNGLETWLLKVLAANEEKGLFPKRAFQRALAERWWQACRAALGSRLNAWGLYQESELADLDERGFWDLLRLRLKSSLAPRGWYGQ